MLYDCYQLYAVRYAVQYSTRTVQYVLCTARTQYSTHTVQ